MIIPKEKFVGGNWVLLCIIPTKENNTYKKEKYILINYAIYADGFS
jgi:hypothetical protein